MENKRKAVNGENRPRQIPRSAREEETLDGRTATAGGNGILQELPRVTAATTPTVGLPSGVSSQFGGALCGGGVSGMGHGVFAPPMLHPPAGNSAPGGSQWRPPSTMTQQPLGDQAGWIAPYGVPARIGYGQNQMANPMGGFAYGDWGFSLPYLRPLSEILSSPAFNVGEPSTPAPSLVGECTICKTRTAGLWTAMTVQGTPVGTPQPLCDDCHSKIFTCDRPLRHLDQHLASTAVGRGAGSIPAFLASIGRHGGDGAVLRFSEALRFSRSMTLLQHQLSDDPGAFPPSQENPETLGSLCLADADADADAGVGFPLCDSVAAGGRAAFGIDVPSGDGHFSSGQNQIVSSDGLPPAPSLPVLSAFSNSIQMCVVCNYHMDTFWDWLPMCKFCYQTAYSYRDRYRARITANASALQVIIIGKRTHQINEDFLPFDNAPARAGRGGNPSHLSLRPRLLTLLPAGARSRAKPGGLSGGGVLLSPLLVGLRRGADSSCGGCGPPISAGLCWIRFDLALKSVDGTWHGWGVPGGSGAWSSSGDAGRAATGRGHSSGPGRPRGEVRHGPTRCRGGFGMARQICLRRRPASPASTRLRVDRFDIRAISA
ncbi:hypothetical protein ZWY2020_018461 [Hordeum vulgare]|nr:hypothetical protein ZWY2020_018461 [Hordeum vulgare]